VKGQILDVVTGVVQPKAMNISEEIERLSKLRDSGALSEEEFVQAKGKVLVHREPLIAAPVAVAPQWSGGSKIFFGVLFLMLGAGLFVWAQGNSPNMSFGEMMRKGPDGLILAPWAYNTALVVATLLVLRGLVLVLRAFIPREKNS